MKLGMFLGAAGTWLVVLLCCKYYIFLSDFIFLGLIYRNDV